MRAFGPFRRRDKPGAALRVKSGDAFAACAEKYGITSREAEIIRLLLEGKDTKRITEDLFISDHTVKNHIHNIYRKLGVRNRISSGLSSGVFPMNRRPSSESPQYPFR